MGDTRLKIFGAYKVSRRDFHVVIYGLRFVFIDLRIDAMTFHVIQAELSCSHSATASCSRLFHVKHFDLVFDAYFHIT